MAVRKVKTPRKNRSEVSEWAMPETNMVVKKSFLEKMAPVMVIALIILSFVLGSMWSKIKYLEAGGGGTAVPGNSKYKKLADAFSAYAKDLKIDQKKFSACLSGGNKTAIIEADFQEGTALGVQGTPGFFVNGKFLPGAFPFSTFKEIIDKELAGTGTNKLTDYSQDLQQSGFVAEAKSLTVGGAPYKGSENAVVTVVEFSDFQCPFCSRAKPTVEQMVKDYEGKVRVAYKHMPLDQLHPNARKAAEASECARDQGKFWEMHDVLFDKQAEWSSLPQV